MNPRKRKKRNSVIQIGTGPAAVKIYTMTRADGYSEHTLAWKEGGRRRRRSISCPDEAQVVAQQITVRLTNGIATGDEVTRRDIELLRYCEQLAARFDLSLTVAMEEWVHARKLAGEIPLCEAVKGHTEAQQNSFPPRTTAEVAEEFVASRAASGVSQAYVNSCRQNLKRFTERLPGQISEITVADINGFLTSLTTLAPVSKNCLRRTIVTMFSFAKKQGYIDPDRKTAAELSETFKVPEKEIEIFTPEEMQKLLLAAHARILPLMAIGAFSGIRNAEICKLRWEDIKWDRGHIEISGRIAKTRARRLVPLSENLKAWLAPWRDEQGPVVPIRDSSGALGDVAVKAGIPGGWRQNGLRHSFISYRVAETGDVARTSLEAGNSPKQVFRHYRAVVDEESAKAWFAITPPEGWVPNELPWPIRERIRRAVEAHRRKAG